jgi:hypothetical protein
MAAASLTEAEMQALESLAIERDLGQDRGDPAGGSINWWNIGSRSGGRRFIEDEAKQQKAELLML